jgi:endogenous inhibitor of DNA gyrase (YacG/DUF329 family)
MKAARKLCPICARPAVADTAPFCSVRCKDDDLRRWLVGAYRIPGDPVPDGGDGEGERREDGR